MTRFSCLTFLLIALSCYALSSSKAIRSESHQATKKVDLPNRISTEPYTQSLRQKEQQQQQQQQFSHAMMKVEARRKRSQREFGNGAGGEFRDLNDIIEDLEDNSVAAVAQPQEFDLENLPPLTYFLLLQKIKQLQSNEPTYRVRTPRLGRSIDFHQLLDAATSSIGGGSSADGFDGSEDIGGVGGGGNGGIGVPRQFVSRVIKKSVPFKPRLGKRTQMCD